MAVPYAELAKVSLVCLGTHLQMAWDAFDSHTYVHLEARASATVIVSHVVAWRKPPHITSLTLIKHPNGAVNLYTFLGTLFLSKQRLRVVGQKVSMSS